MKILKWLILLSIFAICLTLGFYIYNFYGASLSSKTSDWGNFGSYIGGILSSIFSFITIIYLLWSNKQEKEKYDKQQQDNAKEAKKNDFVRMFTLMLEQHNKYIERPEFIKSLDEIYNELLELIGKDEDVEFPYETRKINIDNYVKGKLNEIFNKHHEITTYLSILYRVLKYLTDENQTASNYSYFLRSFCSDKLLFVIASSIFKKSNTQYKQLLEQHNFLAKMNFEILFNYWANISHERIKQLHNMIIEYEYSELKFNVYFDLFTYSHSIENKNSKDVIIQYIKEIIFGDQKKERDLFEDIMNLDPSAFSNSENYQLYKNKKVELENKLKTEFENKIKEVENLQVDE